MTTNKFVFKVLKEDNGFADVLLDREVFKSVAGYETPTPYKTGVTKTGEGVRIYTIAGLPVYRKYVKGVTKFDDKYQFKMKSSDAHEALMLSDDALDMSFA